MINGIPYWGKETFKELRGLAEIKEVNKEKTVEELGIDSLYTLFYELAKKNCVLRVTERGRYFYTYFRDICFNYRDRVIVAPYWSYREDEVYYITDDIKHLDVLEENTVNVRHSFCKLKYIIDNRQTQERVTYLEIYDTEEKELYKVSITGLKYITESDFSILDLHKRYINSSYYTMDNEDYDFENRYHKIEREKGYNKEYTIRSNRDLPHWRKGLEDYRILDYKDVRMYNYDDLKVATQGLFDEKKGYWERRFLFEAYIYCIFAGGLEPIELEYRKPFSELGKKERVLKIDKDGVSLFLKYYYKDEIILRKKTYEKFLKLKNH